MERDAERIAALEEVLERFVRLCENWGSGKQLTRTQAYIDARRLLGLPEGGGVDAEAV